MHFMNLKRLNINSYKLSIIMTPTEILTDFLEDTTLDLNCDIKKVKGQVFEVNNGKLNCLLYVKVRSKYTNWGVTKNIIENLKKETKPWFVVLISHRPLPNF